MGQWDLGLGFGIWDGIGIGIWDWDWDLGFGLGQWDLGLGFGTNGIWDSPNPNGLDGKYNVNGLVHLVFGSKTGGLSAKPNHYRFRTKV